MNDMVLITVLMKEIDLNELVMPGGSMHLAQSFDSEKLSDANLSQVVFKQHAGGLDILREKYLEKQTKEGFDAR